MEKIRIIVRSRGRTKGGKHDKIYSSIGKTKLSLSAAMRRLLHRVDLDAADSMGALSEVAG